MQFDITMLTENYLKNIKDSSSTSTVKTRTKDEKKGLVLKLMFIGISQQMSNFSKMGLKFNTNFA
jgi:hypothetical protein